jgi:predicted dehydrogenase
MSRNVDIGQSEDFVEKQTAEQGLMPVISDEASIYGYVDENRHMVECFRRGVLPRENWYDGLRVIQLMMLGYKSAEERSHLDFNPSLVERYVPLVAQGKLMRC